MAYRVDMDWSLVDSRWLIVETGGRQGVEARNDCKPFEGVGD